MIANLQGVRALAAIAVIIFHSILTAGKYGFQLDPVLLFLKGWGFQGVDVFFVLSGFVMVYSQARAQRGQLGFIRDRLVRIGPTYWALTTIIFVLTLLHPAMFRILWADPARYLCSMSFTCFLHGNAAYTPLVYVGWTLEYEMAFYVAFAISLGLAGWPRKILLGSLLLAALVLFDIMGSLLFEFLIGEFCALYYLSGQRIRHSWPLLLLGLVGLTVPILTLSHYGLDAAEWRFLIYGVPAGLVILWAVNGRQIRNRALLAVGNASYSVYLIQALTIPACCKLFVALAPETPAALVALAGILISILGGLVFYATVERPVLRLCRRWAKRA